MDGNTHDLFGRLGWLRAAADLIGDDGSLRYAVERTAARAYDLFRTEGGCTLRLNGEPVVRGYAVAMRSPSYTCRSLSHGDISDFLDRHCSLFAARGLALGTWKDTDKNTGMVLATRVYTTLDAADKAARRERQQYIGSLHERCSINVFDHADRTPWPNP